MTSNQGKYLFGTVKVGEKGQIVIPKAAREIFGIKPGDNLLLLGDENEGLAIAAPKRTQEILQDIFEAEKKAGKKA